MARAALLPVAATAPAATFSGGSGSGTASGGGSGASGSRKSFNLPFNVSWEPDLWGNIRRGVTASAATAQSLAANVGNARLLYQAELAQDYFGLHGNDGEAELLTRTEASYKEYLTLTRNRVSAGVAADLDVAQAESQLYAVQSQLMDLGVQRAAFEHAIAILIGKAPAELTIPPVTLNASPPPVPLGVPSELLERRPDIAGAERQVAAANEQIGIAIAAFYPTLSLTGSAGLESSSLAKWFTWPSRFWSVGPQLAETLFDARPPPRGGGGTARRLRCDRGRLSGDGADGDAAGGGQPGRVTHSGRGVGQSAANHPSGDSRARHIHGAVSGRNGKLSAGHHLAGDAARRRRDGGRPC